MPDSSRERVIRAVDRVQPDCVPVDFGAHRSSGVFADVPPANVAAMFDAVAEFNGRATG